MQLLFDKIFLKSLNGLKQQRNRGSRATLSAETVFWRGKVIKNPELQVKFFLEKTLLDSFRGCGRSSTRD